MSPLPSPREKLAGCIWLPRIIAKARLRQQDALPPDYAERFGHPTGVDNQFLTFFSLAMEDILSVAPLPDAGVADWFSRWNASHPGRIEEWNHTAENLGRAGFPLAERLPVALATTYRHLDPTHLTSIFDALDADEHRA